ncbi:ubiquinol-cytochrome-c reductase complex assembly factor 3-like [Oxyura jamaicensis]|uniref:ubiquinol-cytochrome-c reductase complex assembly factor 3-like n=1 Tax=Oxyura jamaicensis TaxID=8884 RepID=UPI0015A4F09C|nr:ubiquinol-cytochrome-c reductase complex assembly factor 3-like [Oxyura jamaicensis]
MEAAGRWARALLWGSLPVALGLLLWGAVAAGEDRRRETLKALPEASPELLQQRRRLTELALAALREAAETDENVARRPVPWRK